MNTGNMTVPQKVFGKPARAAVAATMLLLLLAGSAMAAWKNDEPLTYQDKPLLGTPVNARIAWNPATKRVGLAYVESGSGVLTLVEWQPGAGVVAKEAISPTGSYTFGLAYDASGLPRVGAMGASNIVEHVKQADGKWSVNDTGIAPQYTSWCGSYAYNPATQTGAFLVNTKADTAADTLPQATYIYQQDGKWRAAACGDGGMLASSIAFTPAGAPFVIWGKKTPPTKEEPVAMGRVGGDATPGATNFQNVTGPLVYEQLGQGKIAVDPATGDIWVAYLAEDWHLYGRKWTGTNWSAAEGIDIASPMNGSSSAQLGFAISPSQDRVLLYPTTDLVTGAGSSGGLTMAYWSQAKGAWKTETMPFVGDVNGLDLVYDNDGNAYGLYNSLADDQFHLLSGYSPPTPLYVKVKMHDQVEPCVIHVFGLNYNGAGLAQCNIWEDGLGMDESSTRYPEEGPRYLEGNEESPWIDLSPLNLSPAGDNRLQFFAVQNYPVGYGRYGVSNANFSLSFSSTPSADGIIKTFTRTGRGSGMMLLIDLVKRDQIKDDLAASQWQNDIASALVATPGRRPTKFPILTQCVVPSGYYRTETVNTEADTLTRLGFNGFLIGYVQEYDPVWVKAGFPYFASGTNYRFPPYVIDNDRSNLDLPATAEFVKKDLQPALDAGHRDQITFWTLYDEPSSMYMDHIAKCPVCQAKFRNYLQGLGYTPKHFGQSSWDQVLPTNDRSQPKLYYHTAMFRCQILVDLFQAGTAPLKELWPNVPTTANFVEEYTYSGNMLFSGVDQFAMFEQEGLRLGWSGTWLPWTSSLQLSGHVADLLRSAVDGHGTGQFGMYSMRGWGLKLYWDIAAKAVSLVGHGAQQLFHYNWGPFYGMSVDTGSHRPGWYPALQTANYAIGAVEDYLVDATVPTSRVAILYSQATDIWAMNETYSVFGQDNVGLWLILRHLGYPVDFVEEQDVADGRLAREKYRVVICSASHLLDKALPPLVKWLKRGGVLYLGPGALSYDQYNAPLGFDRQAGISRQAFVYQKNPGVANQFHNLQDLMPVTYGSDTLESLSGYQKLERLPSRADVLATFADGSAAALTKRVGRGTLAFSGFFAGLAYEKAAVIARTERDRLDPDFPSQSCTDWPAAHRSLLADLLKPAGHQLPVATSHYLVEADRLEAPATHPGSVIALSNWTGRPVTNLTIVLPRNGMRGAPKTVIHPIVSQQTTDGMLTVTIDMNGPVDFLVVPATGD